MVESVSSKGRWFSSTSFHEGWAERSEELLLLFCRHNDANKKWTFSEYGCGPNMPFKTIVSQKFGWKVITYDMKRWKHNNEVVDLNSDDITAKTTDVGVLSGVCEYLNDVPITLQKLNAFHGHLLISYAALPLSAKKNDTDYLSTIRNRAAHDGWRNHYDCHEMIKIVGSVGYICDASRWQNQMLLYVKSFKCDQT